MAGYDPRRPRPAQVGDDEPAPVEALIDLADHRDDPPRSDAEPPRADAVGGVREHVEGHRVADRRGPLHGDADHDDPEADRSGVGSSRLVLVGVVAACAVALVVFLRRRRRRAR